jgi:hypothetical protein
MNFDLLGLDAPASQAGASHYRADQHKLSRLWVSAQCASCAPLIAR